MSPRVERPAAPYAQIADHYRKLIADGTLRPGTRLPTVTKIAEDWDVSPGTAHKAIRQLAGEKLVEPTQQGTWVLETRATPAPRDRILQVRRGHAVEGKRVEVTEADVRTAPAYVAEVMGLQDGDQVIRREAITYQHDDKPMMLSVVWLPGRFAEAAHNLVETTPLEEDRVIRDATSLAVTHGRDWVTGRAADEREARSLQLDVGAPITAGTWLWSHQEEVIEYGEYVMPANHVVTYEYALNPDDLAADPAGQLYSDQ